MSVFIAMAKFSSDDSKLANDLHEWAINSMHFVPSDIRFLSRLPTADDFKLVCRGQMNDIWQYVITRVHSCQTVRNVKGNLALKRLQESRGYTVRYKSDTSFDSKTAELCDERINLMSGLKSTMSSYQQLEHDIENIQQQILKSEDVYKASLNQLNEVRHKRMLLSSHSQYTTQDLQRVEELARRVHHKYQTLQNAQQTSAVLLSRTMASDDCGLETACMKAVRESCELIATFLHSLLQGGFDHDSSAMTRSKDELWNSVHSVLSSFTASEILSSLCMYTEHTAISLHQKTAAIDICKDAEQLRFKYETGGHLSDLATQPSVLQSIHQLLEVSQATVFAKFVETEKYHNNACKMQRRLAEASQALEDLLRRQFADTERLHLARSILDTETRVASAKIVVKALAAISIDFEDKIMQASADKEVLYAKYQKIQDFKKLTDMKQNLIRVLVKQNMNSRTRLVTQQSENILYAERSLSEHESDVEQLTRNLTDSVSAENDAFLCLMLPLLPNVTLDSEQKICLVDLSIYKLGSMRHVTCCQLLNKLLCTMSIPHVGSEYLLSRIAELQTEAHRIILALQFNRDSGQTKVQHINELCRKVTKHDEETIGRLLPVLQKRLAEATQTLGDCLQVKDFAIEWWDQPAQFCATWVTVDGLTLKQWRDKWTVSATRLRQLPAKGQ